MARLRSSSILWWSVVLGVFVIAVLSGIIDLSWQVLGIVLLCSSCELMDSSLGMGYGTTLTPILLILGFEPLQLVPTILVSEFFSGFGAAFFHSEIGNVRLRRGSPHLRAAVVLSTCSFVGVYAGVQLAFSISKQALTML